MLAKSIVPSFFIIFILFASQISKIVRALFIRVVVRQRIPVQGSTTSDRAITVSIETISIPEFLKSPFFLLSLDLTFQIPLFETSLLRVLEALGTAQEGKFSRNIFAP